MEITEKILKELKNAIEYYNETKDTYDLVNDIKHLIIELSLGYIE